MICSLLCWMVELGSWKYVSFVIVVVIIGLVVFVFVVNLIVWMGFVVCLMLEGVIFGWLFVWVSEVLV